MMSNTANKTSVYGRIIDWVGLFSIGIFCLCYSIFWSSFAEVHLTLPFLNFPIFVGEILLAGCLVLLVLKWKVTSFRFNFWYCLLAAYIGWVLVKALSGYFAFGPLAFRNAALFYYPLFAVVSYHFFSKEYFTQRIVVTLLIFFLLAKVSVGFIKHFFFPYFALSLILILKLERRWLKCLACVLLLCLFPYKIFFHGSRSFLLGNVIAFLFLILTFVFGMLKIKREYKIYFLLLMMGLLALGAFKFSRSARQIESLMAPLRLMEKFREYDEFIQRRKQWFEPQELEVHLYNENSTNYINKALGRPQDAKMQGPQEEITTQEALAIIERKLDATIEETAAKRDIFEETRLRDAVDTAADLLKEQKMMLLGVVEGVEGQNVVEKKEQIAEISQKSKEILRNYERTVKVEMAGSGQASVKDSVLEEKKALEHLVRDAMESLAEQEEIVLEGVTDVRSAVTKSLRTFNVEQGNMLFRMFIWRDMLSELAREKPLFGFSFGKPQRSISIEILDQAHGEWTRDGWITPHNVFIHLVYRAGIVGVLMIGGFLFVLFSLTEEFIKRKAITGLLLVSILVFWTVVANFLVVLELPYQAIPFWALFGVALFYGKTPKDVRA